MARIPKGVTVEINLPDGTATMKLREPTNEELNKYFGDKFDIPAGADRAAGMAHIKDVQARLFDTLLESIDGLEDADGTPVTAADKDKIPADWKSEAVSRRFDRTPVSIKN